MPERFIAWGLAAVDRLELGGETPSPFVVWEIRGRLSVSEGHDGVPEFDGGCRVEWEPGAGGAVPAWRFLVAGSAATLGPLADRDNGRPADLLDPAPQEWRKAVTTLGTRLREKGEGARQAGRQLLKQMRHSGFAARNPEVTVFVRARIWRRGRARAEAEMAEGCRVGVNLDFGRTSGQWGWVGANPAAAPWMAGTADWPEEAEDWARWFATLGKARQISRLDSPVESEVLLRPAAAAWWAHELGHALVEGVSLPHGRLKLTDDPKTGCWPAGFEVDDRGNPAQAAGSDSALRGNWVVPGRFRRGSIREPAIPSLSVTRIDPGPVGPAVARTPVNGTLMVDRVDRGRFDPLSGKLILETRGLFQLMKGEWVGIQGGALLIMDPEKAWKEARLASPSGPYLTDHAICTRQGSVNFVMVGAPTVHLHRVLVCPRFSAKE